MPAPVLTLPVGERRMSSWDAHQRRTTPSSEPGTDWYCPIGTEVLAPADGVVFGSSGGIAEPAGRWIGFDFPDLGLSFRSMHHSRNIITSGRVREGQVYALSGASGYGKEDWSRDPATGGAHVHGTLWERTNRMRFGYRTVNGKRVPWTLDFMEWAKTDMALNAETDYPAFRDMLFRALKWDVRTNAAGPDWRNGPTIWEMLGAADDSNDIAGVRADVKAIAVKMTPEDRAEIAKSVAGAITLPPGGISPAELTKAIDASLAKLVLKPAAS